MILKVLIVGSFLAVWAHGTAGRAGRRREAARQARQAQDTPHT